MQDILSYSFLDIDLQTWLITLGIGAGISILLILVKKLLVSRLKSLISKTSTLIDDIIVLLIESTRSFFLITLALWIAERFNPLSGQLSTWLNRLLFLILLIQAGLWGVRLIAWWVQRYRKEHIEKDPAAVTTIQAAGILGKIFLWLVLFLLTLDNFGVDVTALITGLGIGGIAVALAVQNILGDIFASLSIIFDKPFVVGDFLIVNDYLGSVEHIGLKTTRIRSLSGEQIVFSNNDLLTSRIRNYKRMNERRIVFTVGVEYDTSYDQLKNIPGELQRIIEKQEKTRFDRAHFKTFGDFAKVFECVYYVLDADYNIYMDTQQRINLAINKRFEELEINIAFPTQRLLVHQIEEPSLATS